MKISTLIAAAVIVTSLVFVVRPHIAQATITNDLYVQISGIRGNEKYDTICNTQSIKDGLALMNIGYAKNLVIEAVKNMVESLVNYSAQYAVCWVSGILGFGSGSTGGPKCSWNLGGPDTDLLKRQFLDRIKQDFLSNCTSLAMTTSITDDIRDVLNQNGRDGGPAYVQSWQDMQAQSAYRGLQIARNQMANTQYCPWIAPQMQAIFNFSPAQAVPLTGEQADGAESYTSAAQCTFPSGYDVYGPSAGTVEALAAMMQPQNNIWGAYLLAQENMNRQINNEAQADQNEFANTGGIGALRAINPATGTSCEVMAADNSTCLKYSKITQPAGGVQSGLAAAQQSDFDLLTKGGDVAADLRPRIVSSFMSLTDHALDFSVEFNQQQQELIDAANATPTPGDPNDPNSPENQACTGGNPNCRCVMNDPQVQQIAQGPVLQATQAAIQQHPELVNPDGTLRPGQGINFLRAVCETTLGQAMGCTPDLNSGTRILVGDGGVTTSVDIITSNGVIRQPGQAIAACLPGTQ